MKRTLLLAFLLLPFLAMAQTKPIEGFLGIKFGTSKADCIAALKGREGVMDEKNSTEDKISFTNIKLGSREVLALYVLFIDGKAYEAQFFFKPEVEGDTFKVYNSISDDLNGVYGKGKFYQKFNSPYSNDDAESDKLVALQDAVCDYNTTWINNGNAIQESITRTLYITLRYQSGALFKDAQGKEKAKAKSDY